MGEEGGGNAGKETASASESEAVMVGGMQLRIAVQWNMSIW